jgi:membrane protease YdiL (CAAX protease family)
MFTRRDILKGILNTTAIGIIGFYFPMTLKGIDFEKKDISKIKQEKRKLEEELKKKHDDKKFLYFIIVSCLTIILPSSLMIQKEKELEELIAKFKLEENPTYKDTLKKEAIVMIIILLSNLILGEMIKKLGLTTENSKIKNLKIDTKMIFLGSVVAPPIEEFLFRYLPDLFLKKDKKLNLKVGVPMSILFACVLHNLDYDIKKKKMKFDTEYIPFSNFTTSLFFWYLKRKRGLSHSILTHGFGNFIGLNYLKFVDNLDFKF